MIAEDLIELESSVLLPAIVSRMTSQTMATGRAAIPFSLDARAQSAETRLAALNKDR